MSYYTVVDKCPNCNTLQKRWIVSAIHMQHEEAILCNSCVNYYPLDSSMYQIFLKDNTFISNTTI